MYLLARTACPFLLLCQVCHWAEPQVLSLCTNAAALALASVPYSWLQCVAWNFIT